MSDIAELKNVPDISFTDSKTLQEIRDEMINDYIAAYKEITGKSPELQPASPERIMLYSFSSHFYQALQYVERAGKMGLLKYSEGDYLDNLVATRGIVRAAATPATCTVKFTLSDARVSATGIPGGTRLAAGDVYFATDEYFEISAGTLTGEVQATALSPGAESNSIGVGEIDTLVDPVPYVSQVTNTTAARGGAEIESDDALTERAYMSPVGYSVAGPIDAYIYYAKQARADIGDVIVYSPSATTVNIVFTLADGSLPKASDIADMQERLSADNVRPLTDKVVAMAPTETEYAINMTYYINKSDGAQAAVIQAAVAAAVAEYQIWQRRIGRDIMPSKLIQLVMEAGAKRVAVTSPVYTAVSAYNIASASSVSVTYGGLEDD